jgi:phosphate transport system substrate-binding protein
MPKIGPDGSLPVKKIMIALPLAAALAACGSNGGEGGAAKQAIKVVGSSTVYPFTTAVAEQFQKDNPNVSVVVESTGTGAGMKLFCGGVGANFPDIENASRQIKKSEYDSCVANGVKNVIEVPVGIDGLTFIQAAGGQALNLTQADIYKALAANPFGKGPNTAQTWKDVNPALPAIKIRVLGPPPTSGTRDSLVELYLDKGCNTDPAMKALKESDEARHKDICTKVREDGAFVEAGENDNLLVQKVTADPGTIGILGYSFLEENADQVTPVQINGVSPTEATIADLSYPGARKLYIYIKGEHLAAKPALREFAAAYAKSWGKSGPLEQRGLVPLGGADAETSNRQATELKALDPATLK